jgi:hypothetical protein
LRAKRHTVFGATNQGAPNALNQLWVRKVLRYWLRAE